jgi:hypothetical protein
LVGDGLTDAAWSFAIGCRELRRNAGWRGSSDTGAGESKPESRSLFYFSLIVLGTNGGSGKNAGNIYHARPLNRLNTAFSDYAGDSIVTVMRWRLVRNRRLDVWKEICWGYSSVNVWRGGCCVARLMATAIYYYVDENFSGSLECRSSLLLSYTVNK